jgi:uncharacterized protein
MAPPPPSRPRPPRRPPRAPGSGSRPGAGRKPPTDLRPPSPLDDDELALLDRRLQSLPPPLHPPGLSALDGYLVGVLLQPRPVPAAQWLPFAADVEGRAAPRGIDLQPLHALVMRRHAELDAAIGERDWFDPWLMVDEDEEDEAADEDEIDDQGPAAAALPNGEAPREPEGTADPLAEAVLPWVAGFAAAMDRFPGLTALEDPALLEPMALLYLHFDPDDLEDADELLALIETLEPPADLAEAVQDLVRAVMLMADVSRPLAPAGAVGDTAGAAAGTTPRTATARTSASAAAPAGGRRGSQPPAPTRGGQRPPGRRRP